MLGFVFTDAALPALAKLKNLEILDLSDTRVTDEGVAALAGMKQLRKLVLGSSIRTDTLLRKDTLSRLRESLPDCEITVRRPRAQPMTPGADPFSDIPGSFADPFGP